MQRRSESETSLKNWSGWRYLIRNPKRLDAPKHHVVPLPTTACFKQFLKLYIESTLRICTFRKIYGIIERSLEANFRRCGQIKAGMGRVREEKRREKKRRDVEKVHAILARSTFSKSKVFKTDSLGPLHKFDMSKKCTRLWHEALSFEGPNVKSQQRWQLCSSFTKDGRRGTLAEDLEKQLHVAWHALYKRHAHQRCQEVRSLISWKGLHFEASDFQVC